MSVKQTHVEPARTDTPREPEANGILWLTLSVFLFVLIFLPLFA